MRVCERLSLNPSGWLLHIKPTGIYEMGTRYPEGHFTDGGDLTGGEQVPLECFSIYGVFWTICYSSRQGTDRKPSRWERLWSFLSDVDIGVFDTTNWAPVDEEDPMSHLLKL